MAKKKTRKQVSKNPIPKLETRFDCPLCSHENVVQTKINTKTNRARIFCSVCDAAFACETTPLDKPVDIYYKWIDGVNNKTGDLEVESE